LILVAGASGALGGTAARQLLAAGRPLRALTRHPERLDPLRALGAEVVRGDLLDPESLERACAGVSQVFTTANSFLGSGASAPERVDVPGNRNLIAAAERAGVRHFVFTSAAGIERLASVDYFRAKLDSERHLQTSRVPWTILRPAAFMETWAMLLGVPVVQGTPVRIVGDGRRRANYVCLDDVAAMAGRVLEEPSSVGAIIEFGGPDELTALDIVEIFERLSGRRARRQHAPVPVMRVVSRMLGPFNPVLSRQLRLAVLAATMEEPPLDMAAVLRRYPIPQTRFEEWAARCIQSLTGAVAGRR
jgi:NADH dehydrogenase